ncbi:YtpI family protein [Bacillus swezeyi]|uniref:YtpI family protein n=1 Tax=Bacillus swezeyi TaxID=1925020 RepID=A0A1R1RK74_9BACI|nr:YtpI family protein [Bacillus swezeyi]MEC1262800.1 YtpI family protein [Bacillus swezeyi]MED2928341.1 YtpI family protein [Bacillus swezeyi]MED2944659.1 YtpI family protein [Bacillus swezeyi]MED2966456.1 YtpI family protein [Bacillus swezeyi]MED2975261.1 YtpI family protein [Bacillus swezeyi]
MPFFVFFIVISAIAYVYYKVKYVRTKRAVEKEYLSAKSSMSLGLFIMFFGVNQLVIHRGALTVVIGIIFILTGLGSMWAGYKAYKHYVPLLAKENERENA